LAVFADRRAWKPVGSMPYSCLPGSRASTNRRADLADLLCWLRLSDQAARDADLLQEGVSEG